MTYFDGFIRKHCAGPQLSSESLEPIQRVLLSTDGTVTDALEAYYLETMNVRLIDQYEVEAAMAPTPVSLQAKKSVLKRVIALYGAESGRVYLFAESFILLEAFDEATVERLRAGRMPIGAIIAEKKLETRREIFQCGRCNRENISGGLMSVIDEKAVFRTYGIFHDGIVVMLITEYFPSSRRYENLQASP